MPGTRHTRCCSHHCRRLFGKLTQVFPCALHGVGTSSGGDCGKLARIFTGALDDAGTGAAVKVGVGASGVGAGEVTCVSLAAIGATFV